jgi:uncharacterized protein (TIGR02145 family)
MKHKIFVFKITVLTLLFFYSCKEIEIPSLKTNEVIEITQTTAIISGVIYSDGGSSIKTRGYCIDIKSNTTIDKALFVVNEGNGIGEFNRKFTKFEANKTYFIRVFAINENVVVYGNEVQFTTLNDSFMDPLDGTVYKIVNIGSQIWFSENLRTTKLNDGINIPKVTNKDDWSELTSNGYCVFFNNSDDFADKYGYLYNWYAVNSGKLCPIGWHVPTIEEWNILFDYLGGADVAGGKLKESGIENWSSPNNGATNEVGFNAIGGGFRYESGLFYGFGDYATFWTASEGAPNRPYAIWISNMGVNVFPNYQYNDYNRAFNVRCIKN